MKRDLQTRTVRLLVVGIALLAAGLVCDVWLPINKKLWTSSFALFMAGLDFVVFAAFLWVVDQKGYRRWTRPLEILGMNAIAIYMASEMLEMVLSLVGWRDPIYRTVFVPIGSTYNASLAYAVAYTLVMFAIAYGMYRRGWFVRV